MNQNKAAVRTSEKGCTARQKKAHHLLPALFGITIAFALACLALCWMILNDSSNLMNNKADITLGDYIGMTQEEACHRAGGLRPDQRYLGAGVQQ